MKRCYTTPYYTTKEISKILNMLEREVRKTAHEAMQKIKSLLGELDADIFEDYL